MAPGLSGLLLTLVLALAAGAVLRRSRRLPGDAATVLNRVIVDVTLPALVIAVLPFAELDRAIVAALVVTLSGQVVGFACGISITRALGLSRATQGAAGLVAGFANTGFLGIPVAIALFGGRGVGPSTAILIDGFNTTALLWTSGLLFARRMGDKVTSDAKPRSVLAALVTPLSISVLLALAMNLAHVHPPELLRGALEKIGAATTALVFLALGLSLDVRALKGRVAALGLVTITKLAIAPVAAYAAARALHLHGTIGSVAVLQASMPTAMLSVVLAAESGCDASFAAGVAVATTLVSLVTMPLVIRLLGLG